MAIEVKVPTVGESISEVTLSKWVKADGEYAERDEVIAELESEKATFEINAEQAGVIKHIAKEGDDIAIGGVVATIDTDAARPEGAPAPKAEEAPKPKEEVKETKPAEVPAARGAPRAP